MAPLHLTFKMVHILGLMTLMMRMVDLNAFPISFLEYLRYGCKGYIIVDYLFRLDRLCNECYNLYQNQQILVDCKQNCFENCQFKACVMATARTEEWNILINMAKHLQVKNETMVPAVRNATTLDLL
ncbi:alpha-latrotoxin associated low molecular weight protein 2-like [Stegodyphus dumicola]|uniref:alpha-latrotoxin associated low molecular weight protein 2-like n=1 Tax=Stegodyphus dumicola TaxID=202533 RepID=UPI0015B2D5C5|nr:alpha-latrotoxin associated low molecular weight protein 2-like [Stegodyphus dumicola]